MEMAYMHLWAYISNTAHFILNRHQVALNHKAIKPAFTPHVDSTG